MDLSENRNLNELEFRHPWEISRFHFIKRIFKKLIKTDERYILDFGSGDGFILSQMKKEFNDLNLIAVDKHYSSKQLIKIKEKLKTDHVYNKIDEINIEDRKINVIFMLDVIEHIKYPEKTLEKLINSNLLSKDCIFIITVPSYQALFTKHDELLGHHRRYNLKTLKSCLNNSGLKILDNGYFFHLLLIVRLFEKIAEILFNYDNSNKVARKSNNYYLRMILLRFLISENDFFYNINKISGISVPGLSIYTTCQVQH